MEHKLFLEVHGVILHINPRVSDHIYGLGVDRVNDTKATQAYPANDPHQEYKINSLGYRSKEFKQGTPLLVAGCSYTYGAGLPEDATWGAQLGSKLNLEYSNLSRYGASIPWIVRNVLAYCREFGNPDHIVCAFPNLLRGQIVTDQHTTTVEKSVKNHPYQNDVQSYLVTELNPNNKPKVSKRPHEIDDVLTPETAILYSVDYIRILEQYCATAGINLMWSMLEAGAEHHVHTLPKEYGFNNHVDLSVRHTFMRNSEAEAESGYYHNDEFPDRVGRVCHQEEFKRWGKDIWLLGTDRGYSLDSAHPGVHMSIHWADGFYKEFMERQEQS